MIQKRKEKVTGLEKSIEGAQQDLTAKTESYASGIKEARAAGLKERDALIAEASIREKEVIAKINQRAREELTGLKEKIGKDAAGIRNILEKEVGSYAESIAQKILGRAD
jgi:F0F1-type ATP synthase membrane subunit b/b'